MAALPQRLEAAIDYAAVTARVELVPFPFVPGIGVFPQPIKQRHQNLNSVAPLETGQEAVVQFEKRFPSAAKAGLKCRGLRSGLSRSLSKQIQTESPRDRKTA
jgi:hypothetical protein